MKIFNSAAVLGSAALLASCSTIIEGSTDKVNVTTSPQVQNARCDLKNGRGQWDVSSPGTTQVKKSKTDLQINCQDPVNGATGTKTIESDVDAWYFGNIIFGGIIGLIVDPSTGSMWKYQSDVTVVLNEPVNLLPAPAPVQPQPQLGAPVSQVQPPNAVQLRQMQQQQWQQPQPQWQAQPQAQPQWQPQPEPLHTSGAYPVARPNY